MGLKYFGRSYLLSCYLPWLDVFFMMCTCHFRFQTEMKIRKNIGVEYFGHCSCRFDTRHSIVSSSRRTSPTIPERSLRLRSTHTSQPVLSAAAIPLDAITWPTNNQWGETTCVSWSGEPNSIEIYKEWNRRCTLLNAFISKPILYETIDQTLSNKWHRPKQYKIGVRCLYNWARVLYSVLITQKSNLTYFTSHQSVLCIHKCLVNVCIQ